jgi:hypothetical protein
MGAGACPHLPHKWTNSSLGSNCPPCVDQWSQHWSHSRLVDLISRPATARAGQPGRPRGHPTPGAASSVRPPIPPAWSDWQAPGVLGDPVRLPRVLLLHAGAAREGPLAGRRGEQRRRCAAAAAARCGAAAAAVAQAAGSFTAIAADILGCKASLCSCLQEVAAQKKAVGAAVARSATLRASSEAPALS